MPKVFKIGVTKINNQAIQEVEEINLLAGKGIIGDRHFNENNEDRNQLTLIEKENIDYYNNVSENNIPYINFRRNIITSGIQLNELVGEELLVGNVRIKAHRLCDPCKYLQDKLNDSNLVKKLLNRGGLRCEILSDGTIAVDDEIKKI